MTITRRKFETASHIYYIIIIALCERCMDVYRLYWTDKSRNTVESITLQSMQHRVEDIPLSTTKLISDIASYKASDHCSQCAWPRLSARNRL